MRGKSTGLQGKHYPADPPRDGGGRQIVIVGAGPAGLTAANELAARGFKVTVLEKNESAGGQLILAAAPPYKEKINWFIEELTHSALQRGVTIQYKVSANKAVIDQYHPFAVIVATGADVYKRQPFPPAHPYCRFRPLS